MSTSMMMAHSISLSFPPCQQQQVLVQHLKSTGWLQKGAVDLMKNQEKKKKTKKKKMTIIECCEQKEEEEEASGRRRKGSSKGICAVKIGIGSPIIVVEAPKILKTAASVPCLRPNSGLLKPGDVGRIVSRKPKGVWAVRLTIGTYLLEAKYFKPLDLDLDLDQDQ